MTGRTLEFRFEELPLVVDDGFEAAEVSGRAEISFHGDGEWCVRAIALDGARRLPAAPAGPPPADPPPRFARRSIALDDGDPLFLRILDRLEHAWAGRVADAVIAALGEARAARDDDRHDHRRALRCGI
ncbi:MAG: hypothetical protein P4M07_08770 [Xanthobacteraceae bacterium]|nr:hypothetical protein [Xanthobacteraceae bacterium]